MARLEADGAADPHPDHRRRSERPRDGVRGRFRGVSEPRVSDRESVRRDRGTKRAREDRCRCGLPRPRDLDERHVRLHRAIDRARTRYLVARGREDWTAEIEGMIADHHKITPSTADPDSLIEAFRRADWIDVTRGLRRFGIPRPFVARLFATWPSAGFHWRLVTLTLDRFRSHPLTPLPMVRL